MNEEEWVRHWEGVLGSIYVMDGFDRSRPNSTHLDALESRIGLRLPLSYRAFLRTFGPGRLAQAFTIYAPGYPDAPVVDFLEADGWQGVVGQSRGGSPLVSRLVAFGDYLGHRGLFAWHRDVVTDAATHEYQIYFVPRNPDEPIIPVSRSFATWVEEDALGSAFYPKIEVTVTDADLAWEDETGEIRSHRCFEPIGDAPQPLST